MGSIGPKTVFSKLFFRSSELPGNSNQSSLLRRLSIASLLAILIAAPSLVYLYRYEQINLSEEYFAQKNERFLFHLANTLSDPINTFIANSAEHGSQTALPNFDALFTSALEKTDTHTLLKLKIYDLAGTTIYSSAKHEIGKTSQRPELLAKALHGEAAHSMEHRNTFSGMNGEMRDVHIYMTYMPFMHGEKQTGVIESYDDISRFIYRLDVRSIQITLVVLGVFGALYAALFYAIRRTDHALTSWQKAVAESQNLLQTIIDAAPVRVFWKDRESRYICCNPAFAKDAGETTPQNIIGKTDYQLSWHEQAGLYQADDRQVIESGIPKLAYEEPQTTPDGKVIWLQTSKVPLRNAANEIIGVLGVYQDITERKQMEEKLLMTQFVSDQAPDSICWIDKQAHIVYANESACRGLGYANEELLAMSLRDINPNFKFDVWPSHWQELQQKGDLSFETRHRRKDGSIFPVEVSANYIKFDGKEFNVVFMRDITRRKQHEDALRIAAATFETQDAIVITDTLGNIVRVNRAFSDITGYSAKEVLGKNPRIMSSGRHDRSFYIEMWQRLLRTGNWAGEIYDRRKSGEVYPKWMTITAVKNEQQETTHYVAIFSDITARKRIEEEIHNLAFYDALTKLPNRRLFLERFRTALTASARRNDYGSVLFIDLDRFKSLNDTFGHDYGDLLLIEVGARIKSCVREMDTVARFGGDEFVVLIESSGSDPNDATRKISLVAEKVREALARPYDLKGHEHHSSPSIGICLYHGNDDTLEALIEHADMAMYQAKNSGRNAVRFFDPIMQKNAATHDALENDLHYAIELQQMHLHYQIQVDSNNRPQGAEAFLRWKHPEQGMFMPGQFLPIAEESDVIIKISRWVLQSACRQLALWGRDAKTRNLTLTINISAKHFGQPDFVSEVTDILKIHQANPTRLKLELSEKLVLTEVNSTVDKIRALRNLGVKVAMDNFNTVYSSLSFIKELSSDQLKIHQEFVQGLTTESGDTRLVQTLIDLAKSLELDIFAEGVETEAQRTFLEKHDCNLYQGYLFGKPMSIEEFDAVIAKL
ncbi:MAG: diguanylate cyclase/phosphodiesterase with PAS/PAC [Gallionellaceae bacterium]|nr:MAG: diguanylate cyclase/phosphodiesterase with PAS/PAC [Gallionellaceae bacterium]